MRRLILALALLFSVSAQAAETQAAIRKNIGTIINRHGFPGTDGAYIVKYFGLPKVYLTAVERAATTPDLGTYGYAVDDKTIAFYTADGWMAATIASGSSASISGVLTVTGATYANGGVDRSSAAALAIGATNATAVNIGATATPVAITAAGGVTIPSTTTATGAIFANGGVDRSTAAGLLVGATNATSVTITPPTTITGDVILNGGATALTFGAGSSSVVTTDNSATGLIAGSAGHLNTLTLDTRDGAEGLAVSGYETVSGALTVTGTITGPLGATRSTGTPVTLTATSPMLQVASSSADALTVYTLPAASTAGLRFCFIADAVANSTRAIKVEPPAGSDIIVGTTTAAGTSGIATTAGAGFGIINTHASAVRGNFTCLMSDGVNTWYMTSIGGTWAAY